MAKPYNQQHKPSYLQLATTLILATASIVILSLVLQAIAPGTSALVLSMSTRGGS